MAFIILYEDSDLAAIAQQVRRDDLSAALKVLAQVAWDGGLKNYNIAPTSDYGIPNGGYRIRQLQISSPLSDLVSLLRGIASEFPNDPKAGLMGAIADDLTNTAIEPWLPV